MMMNSIDNYFELFGLKPSFIINRTELDTAYRKLQQASHPDRFVNQPAEFQRKAVQQTAQNTEAYHALKSPVQRACHLLSITGTDFKLSSYTVTDINLLMQQMQYREQLNEIKEQGDFEKLQQFADDVDGLLRETENTISTLFKQGIDKDPANLKNHICELQFLNKLVHDLNEVEDHMMS